MSKICGYSCEHNKSGVCQISVCDKKMIMSDKTEVQTFTRYIDTTITELQQENKKLKEAINQAIEYIHKYNSYFIDCYEDKKGDTYSKDVEVIEIIPKDLKKILNEAMK